jgi:hypothetical protein
VEKAPRKQARRLGDARAQGLWPNEAMRQRSAVYAASRVAKGHICGGHVDGAYQINARADRQRFISRVRRWRNSGLKRSSGPEAEHPPTPISASRARKRQIIPRYRPSQPRLPQLVTRRYADYATNLAKIAGGRLRCDYASGGVPKVFLQQIVKVD